MRDMSIQKSIAYVRNEPYHFSEDHISVGGYLEEYNHFKESSLISFYNFWEIGIWEILKKQADTANLGTAEYVNKLSKENNIIIKNGKNFSQGFKVFIAGHIIYKEER